MELHSMTAHELGEKIRKREIKVKELVEHMLDRINTVDKNIAAYLTVTADRALEDANRIQKSIDSGDDVSPLAGIPMAVKDNMCTEGIPTTCASRILHNFVPPYSATAVNRLFEKGAIMLGKSNLDEFAMGGSTENSYFKKTRNPWDTGRVPGGSSGGSAASVASGEAVFALGSDTGGSIRQPAAFCGVVGMKPTYGAVSRFGLVAFASSLDQIGPLTRDIKDCALVMNAICGYDPMDSTSADVDHPDYTGFLTEDVKGFKIGVPSEYMAEGVSKGVGKALNRAMDVYRSLGAECEEFSLPVTEYSIPAYYIISSAEASSNLARYDGIKYGYRAESFEDLADLYRKSRSEGFGDEVKRRIMLGTYALSSGYYDAYYKKALKVRTIIMEQFEKALERYDLVLGPTAPTTAYKIGEKTDNPLEMYLGDIFTASVNIAGLPGLSLPCGFDEIGLPVGMQLIGKAFGEGLLLRAGYAFESNTNFHKKRPSI